MIKSVINEKRISVNGIIKWLLYGINIGVSAISCNVIYNLYVLRREKMIGLFLEKSLNVTKYSEPVADMILSFFMIIFAVLFIGNLTVVSRFCAGDMTFRQDIRKLMRAIGYNKKKRLLYEYLYVCADMVFGLPAAAAVFAAVKCICANMDMLNQLFMITGDSVFYWLGQWVTVCMVYAAVAFVTAKRHQ